MAARRFLTLPSSAPVVVRFALLETGEKRVLPLLIGLIPVIALITRAITGCGPPS